MQSSMGTAKSPKRRKEDMSMCRSEARAELFGGLACFLGLETLSLWAVHLIAKRVQVSNQVFDHRSNSFVGVRETEFTVASLPSGCVYEVYAEVDDCDTMRLLEVSKNGSLCERCLWRANSCSPSGGWQDAHRPPLRLIAMIAEPGHEHAFTATPGRGVWILNSCATSTEWLPDALLVTIAVAICCIGLRLCYLARTE